MIVAGAVAETPPLVPVTVTVYVPAVVPALTTFEQATEVEDPLHPPIIPKPNPISNISAKPRRFRRRSIGTNSTRKPASAKPVWFAAEFARQLLYVPADVSEIVAVPVPPAARFKLPGDALHVGGTSVTGDTAQLSATVPANPFTEVPVSNHMLVVVILATGVTESVDGLAESVKLPATPPPPPPDAAAMKSATSSDPNPVA
jgi:hypothetical protein